MNCLECGRPAQHAHHVVPRSRGGRATVPLCEVHHALVHGLDPETWVDHSRLTREGISRSRKPRARRPGASDHLAGLAVSLHAGGKSDLEVLVILSALGGRAPRGGPLTPSHVRRLIRDVDVPDPEA